MDPPKALGEDSPRTLGLFGTALGRSPPWRDLLCVMLQQRTRSQRRTPWEKKLWNTPRIRGGSDDRSAGLLEL